MKAKFVNTRKCRTFVLPSLSAVILWHHAGALAVLHGESDWIVKTGRSSGIDVAFDFDDGRSIASFAVDGRYLVHGLRDSEVSSRRRVMRADDTVTAAGDPRLDGCSLEDTGAAFAREIGGIDWQLDVKDDRNLQELRFDAPPASNGFAISHANDYVCLKDGSVVWLSSNEGN